MGGMLVMLPPPPLPSPPIDIGGCVCICWLGGLPPVGICCCCCCCWAIRWNRGGMLSRWPIPAHHHVKDQRCRVSSLTGMALLTVSVLSIMNAVEIWKIRGVEYLPWLAWHCWLFQFSLSWMQWRYERSGVVYLPWLAWHCWLFQFSLSWMQWRYERSEV